MDLLVRAAAPTDPADNKDLWLKQYTYTQMVSTHVTETVTATVTVIVTITITVTITVTQFVSVVARVARERGPH